MSFTYAFNPFTCQLDIAGGDLETDPLSIHLDGSSTTTAVIPFAEGISLPESINIQLGTDGPGGSGLSGYGYLRLLDNGVSTRNVSLGASDLFSGKGLDVDILAGSTFGSGDKGGNVYIRAGWGDGGGDVLLHPGFDIGAGTASGVVKIFDPDTLTYWTLFDTGGNSFTQQLTTSGITTIQTHTGILKGTAGVVSTASGSDLLTAIGTIDISNDTNLAVSSPITLTGDTVGFDATANFTWTGTHDFQNNVTWNTSGSTSYLATFGNTSLASAIISPTGSSDCVVANKQSTTNATTRAFTAQNEWNGSVTNSNPVNGFNAFAYTGTGATAALSSTSAQGALRNRMVVRHRATNAAATITRMVGLSGGAIIDAGVAAVTDAVSLLAEAESVGLAATVTNNYGLLTLSNAIVGTITNNYGIYITELLAGTNRYEQFFEGSGGSFYRAAAQQIYSSASNTLDFDAGTTQNWRVGGTTEMSLTSTLLTVNNKLLVTATESGSYPYLANITSSNATSYLGIFNSGSSGGAYGAFFGLESNDFAIYNFQGGNTIFYNDTSPAGYSNVVTITTTGDVAVESGKKIYFEGASSDTYISYNSGSSQLEVYVNGALAGYFK